MKETIDDILTELSCKGWQEAVHEIEKALEEKDREIERLNNIINEIDKEITKLFLGSALKNDTKVFNVLYHLGVKIKKLEGVDKE